MTMTLTAYLGADIFDGAATHTNHALIVEGDRVQDILPVAEIPPAAETVTLPGGTILPGYVDLQVNGGGGVQFNDDPSVAALRTIAAAHAGLGATAILPTLITDTADRTRAAIAAVEQAIATGVPGIIGLHLEGPHLSLARKGAHDPSLIRPMEASDLDTLCAAAGRLPVLMLTVAPETVTPDQIRALTAAGAIVSLGHSEADFATCAAAVDAGATCVTHLFNAMRQIANRDPGVVGAALAFGGLSAGLIADGIHVHPQNMAMVLRAKAGPGEIFLVSDSMAPAGSDIHDFTLNGRRILRKDGRLTLEDGTLAGADLDLSTAIRVLVDQVGQPRDDVFRRATQGPARVIGRDDTLGVLKPGGQADFLHLDAGLTLTRVWRGGVAIG